MKDWLSPIVVKELRQGMRARAFEGAFVMLQLLMLFAIVMAVMAVSSQHSDMTTAFGEGLFWTMLAIPVLLVMPMRGCNALRNEIDGRSLELIFLTRLSAWRIVAGKWAALFAQTCLLVVAVLPYAVLRYYLGSVNLFRDLLVIAILLGTSGLLTAMTVSISGFHSKLARSAVFVFPIVMLMFGPSFVMAIAAAMSFGGGSSMFSWLDWKVYAGFAFYGIIALVYLLEVGASRIAPVAENHAVRKRMLGVLIFLSGFVALMLGIDEEFVWFPILLTIVVCIDSLCKAWNPVPGNFLPLRRSRVGRVFANFLLPGWPSGFLYTIAMFGGFVLLLVAAQQLDDIDVALVFIAIAGTVIYPIALIRMILPRTDKIAVLYFVIQLVVLITTLVSLMINELFNKDFLSIFSISPLSTLILEGAGEANSSWLAPCAVILGACVLIIVAKSRQEWQQMREQKKQAMGLAESVPMAEPDAAG